MDKQERRNYAINNINKMGYKNKSRICWSCPDKMNNCNRKCVYRKLNIKMEKIADKTPEPYPVSMKGNIKLCIAKFLYDSGQWDSSIIVDNFRHDNIVNQIIVNEDLPTEVIVSFDMLKLYLKINGLN